MPDPPDGLLGRLFPGNDPNALYSGLLSDPATQAQFNQRALAAMAGSFADSAMPTRMPTPLGAVLGHAAAAMGTSGDAVMGARLQEAQSEQARAQSQLTQQEVSMAPALLAAAQNWSSGGAGATVPGTIGAPSAATAPADTGRGPLGITIPPGTPTAAFDPKLPGTDNLNNLALAAAPIALPSGYTIEMTPHGGDRPGATAPGGGASQHATANAADFVIKGPDGKPIPNTGADTTQLYGKLAVTMRMIADPAIKPWLAWGGNFTNAEGQPDLMHFDFAGDRGHLGTLAVMEQQATPQNPSGAPPWTVRASWFGNAPGWTDKNDRGLQANGQPVSAGPGIALPIPKDSPDFGKFYDVTAPNGQTLRLQQTDVGPGPEGKGRGVDVNAVAAAQFGYTPGSFPTDGAFRIAPAGQRPVQVAQADTGTATDATSGPARGTTPGLLTGPPPVVNAPAVGAPGWSPSGPQAGTVTSPNQPIGSTGQSVPRPPMPPGLVALQPGGPAPPGPAPAPPGPQVAASGPPPPPAAPSPQSLIPPPAPVPTVPITQPQPPVAPTIPGAPSPERIRQAQAYAALLSFFKRPIPPDVAATATYGLDIAKAAGTAAATSPIEVQKAIDIAKGTLSSDIAKAQAGPIARGEQARLTAGDEMVKIEGLGWVQRKTLPGFTYAGSGAPAMPTGAGPGTAAPSGPTSGTASPAAGAPVVLAPSTTPAQAKLFETNLAQATDQMKPYTAEGLAAPQQKLNAQQITDLLGKTAMGWGADSKQEAAMIMRGLGVSEDNIKTFTGFVGQPADPTYGAALNKMFLKFSSDAVLRLGTHEAASVMGQFAKTYPSLESDPHAAELMTNALYMEAQWRQDRADAAQTWDANQKQNMGPFGQNYHGLNGFEASFNKTNDPTNYWRAALAMSGFSDLAFRDTSKAQQATIFAHVPVGRRVVGPNGKVGVKPPGVQ